MADNERMEAESRSGKLIGGCIVTGVGILFLLINYDILPPMEDTWPFFMIIVGISLIIGAFVKKKKKEENSNISQ